MKAERPKRVARHVCLEAVEYPVARDVRLLGPQRVTCTGGVTRTGASLVAALESGADGLLVLVVTRIGFVIGPIVVSMAPTVLVLERILS